MNTDRYEWVKAYHCQLLSIAEEERKVRSLRGGKPTWRDRAFLQLGDLLIALGERVRNESAYAKLCEECA
jgi:hypothetical protein